MILYSILVSAPNNENTTDTYAADWGRLEGLWTTSYKECCSIKWYFQNEFYPKACRDVLKAFGLSEKDFPNFSLENIVAMSPKELAWRGTKDPLSATIGDNRRASEVEFNEENYVEWEELDSERKMVEFVKSKNLTFEALLICLRYQRIAHKEDGVVIEEPSYEDERDYEIGALVRAEAARKLGELKYKRAVTDLIAALGNESGDQNGRTYDHVFRFSRNGDLVMISIMEALGKLGEKEAVPALEDVIRSGHSDDAEGEHRSYSTRECLGCKYGNCKKLWEVARKAIRSIEKLA